MNEIAIDFDTLNLGKGNNPFDELASQIERLKLEGKIEDAEKLEKTILFLERKYQDFSETNQNKSRVIFEAIKASTLIFREDNYFTFSKIEDNLKAIKNLSINLDDDVKHLDKFYISSIINEDVNRNKYNPLKQIQIAFDKLKQTANVINNSKEKEEWTIELNFDTKKGYNHKPLEFIHTFIEGLNTIEGVKLTLEDIKIGSIKAKIKTVFDNLTSKEEFKEALDVTKKCVQGKLEKEYINSEKIKVDTVKSNIESEILKENLDTLKSSETKEFKRLESESIRYDIERKKLENQKLELELFRDKKNLLMELLADGIINQQKFEILIKGIPFIKMDNNNLTIGESIDVIDDM